VTAAAAAKPDPADVFRLRCEARSMLVDLNMLELQTAVDELWESAERDGLPDQIGQDGVQAIMSAAFNMGRRP
jgi:hypothetical protein